MAVLKPVLAGSLVALALTLYVGTQQNATIKAQRVLISVMLADPACMAPLLPVKPEVKPWPKKRVQTVPKYSYHAIMELRGNPKSTVI